jgi:2-octaprenyl-6-methoxyphenol hydroxylase
MARFDIVICGGSFAGLALARAITAAAPGAFSIAIVEQKPLDAARLGAFDGRSAAITASVKTMLATLGVWQRLKNGAQPIERIELTDTDVETPIRTTLLALDAADAEDGHPTAHIVENADLRQALFASLDGCTDVTWFAPNGIEALETSAALSTVVLSEKETLETALVVAADGQNSATRDLAGIRCTVWDSDKVGITATVGITRGHDAIARQHFLPSGPFAILPMTGDRVSIVWTEKADAARAIMSGDRERILSEIAMRAGPEYGTLTLLSKPQAYPLRMTLANAFVQPRLALIGDAAHGLHWIAGQGLNHSLKDVAALAETLADAARLGLDIGSLDVLKRYERWRRFDSTASAFTAAALNTLFSNNSALLRMVRSAGMRIVDRAAMAKPAIMKEAAGQAGALPKLMQGVPL